MEDPRETSKQHINWNFIIKYIDPKDPDDQDIPHRWMGKLVITVVYHIESVELIEEDDNIRETVFLIRGLLRLSRRVSMNVLRTSIGVNFEDDDIFEFTPYHGVFNTKNIPIQLPLDRRYNGFFREYGSRFIPRQGVPKGTVLDFVPIYPGPPTCLNKCKCCSVKHEQKRKIEELQLENEELKLQLLELKTGRKRKK